MKMPVRDMLRNIRIAKGIDPKDLQVNIFFFYLFIYNYIEAYHGDHSLTVSFFCFVFRENILRQLKVRLKYVNVSITVLTSLHF